MKKSLSFTILLQLFSLLLSAQNNNQTVKECTISGGIGIARATRNTITTGLSSWVQLAYKLSENISVATEYENSNYKQPTIYQQLPENLNKINIVNFNFSLLLKYHFPVKSSLKIAFASGWTQAIRHSSYYVYSNNGTSQYIYKNESTLGDYRIPLLLEVEYPLSKKINIQARGKYNMNNENGDTYSSGIGLSLKL